MIVEINSYNKVLLCADNLSSNSKQDIMRKKMKTRLFSLVFIIMFLISYLFSAIYLK